MRGGVGVITGLLVRQNEPTYNGGRVYSRHAWPESGFKSWIVASLPCRDGARRVFTDQAEIACTQKGRSKGREVFAESHEGLAASCEEPISRWTLFNMDDSAEGPDDVFSGVATSRHDTGGGLLGPTISD